MHHQHISYSINRLTSTCTASKDPIPAARASAVDPPSGAESTSAPSSISSRSTLVGAPALTAVNKGVQPFVSRSLMGDPAPNRNRTNVSSACSHAVWTVVVDSSENGEDWRVVGRQ